MNLIQNFDFERHQTTPPEGKLGSNKTNPSQWNYECYARIRQEFCHQ